METKSKMAFYLGLGFLGLLTLMHLIEPEFNPAWRMISEYELGKYGFLMRIAFFCWGGGFLFLSISIWNLLNSTAGKIGKWWLLIISVALFGAGIFKTQPITDTVRGTTDALHGLCGFLMIFTFPIVSILIAKSLSGNSLFQSSKTKLLWLTILVWIGFITFLIAAIIYHPENRAYNSDYLIGWPNRFMVVCYTVWLLGLSWHTYKSEVNDAK